ncbi:hypothetical protein [Deinococcus humi]|uniref:Hpr(Ser) kinase/phosphatase n=1 Tax=Deinococcus humi TaxID=662880 RepID=A0A7W8JWQ0_9DEIO|nr:hypothetical protein [Deinococcus humi]MBB5364610.1 hypothetical protein [Deinococcus humi]GGO39195.1 hypothetical protein GCM10008949_46910 [Deinococcus humi]
MTRGAQDFLSLDALVTTSGIGEDVLGPLRQQWGYAGVSSPSRKIILRYGSLAPVPPVAPVEVMVARMPLPVRVRGDELWLGEALHLEVQGGDVCLTLGNHPVPAEAWFLAWTEAHRAGGWLPLHSAVLMQGEQAVGLTGVSGAGKSTAALRLAGLGVTILSEDQAWVRPEDQRVVGFDQHLRAFDDSVRTFAPHLLSQAAGHDAYGKLLLPLTHPGAQATLQSLLVFGLSPEPSLAERIRALWDATGVPLTQTGRQATASGVGVLLRHLHIQGVTREDVLRVVRPRLGLDNWDQSGS